MRMPTVPLGICKDVGYFFVRHILQIVKDEDFPVFRLELGEPLLYHLFHFLQFALAGRGVLVGGVRNKGIKVYKQERVVGNFS